MRLYPYLAYTIYPYLRIFSHKAVEYGFILYEVVTMIIASISRIEDPYGFILYEVVTSPPDGETKIRAIVRPNPNYNKGSKYLSDTKPYLLVANCKK